MILFPHFWYYSGNMAPHFAICPAVQCIPIAYLTLLVGDIIAHA